MMAASAQGGVFDRPDILDVNDDSKYTGTGTSAPYSYAFMYASRSWAGVSGSISGSVRDANNRVRIWSHTYQPDTVKRNHRMAKADQKRHTGVWVALYALPTDTLVASGNGTGFPEKCKSQIKAQDRDRDGLFELGPGSSGDDRIRGKLRCPKDLLELLGFSPAEIGAIQGAFSKQTKFTVKLP
jgi:hypothetical protein